MNCFMQFCRLCTSDKNISLTIHNLDSDGKSFIDKLEAIAPEIIDCVFKLPNGICTICAVQLNEAYKFIKQCFDSQIILKQHLNEQLCRLCTSNKDISLTLNTMDSDNVLLSHKLEAIALEILECNEKLSNYVCSICSVRLNKTYKFVENCFKSQEILKRYAKQQLQNDEVVKNKIVDDTNTCLNNNENNTTFDSICIKKEIIDEEYIQLDLESDLNIKIEESLESENTIFDATGIKEETIDEEYSKVDLDNDINIKLEESFELEDLNLHSELIIKEEHSDLANETDSKSYPNENTIFSSEEIVKSVKKKKFYQCNLCDKTFTNSQNLHRHNRIHANKKLYKCKICNEAFNDNIYLKRHFIRFHTNERHYKCKICEKTFIYALSLKRHVLRHSNEKPYKCEICEKAFVLSQDLKSHIRSHTKHGKDIRSHTKPGKAFKCEICEKTFTEKIILTRHIRIHTNERPYKCDLCEKAFKQSGDLTRHVRRHNNQKPFKCEICDRTFTESGHLKRHGRIHANNRSHKCELCEKIFIYSGHLKKHIRNFH